MAQLIITMRRELAKRFAKDRSSLDVQRLFAPFDSVELIGPPGYSMRVAVAEADISKIKNALADNFIVESDYVMQLLAPDRPAAHD